MGNKCPDICCREMVIMPNHFHCILELTGEHAEKRHDCPDEQWDAHAGAPLRGRPDNNESGRPEMGDHIGSPQRYGPDNKKYGATIGEIIDWFKTMTTNEYIHGVKNFGWKRFDEKLWQRNYWDHIIRNGNAYFRIAEYIENNPSAWKNDKLYPDKAS